VQCGTHACDSFDQCQVSDSVVQLACTAQGIDHASMLINMMRGATLDMLTLVVCVDLESYPCLQHVMFPGQAVWL
jgi:hypothetical protein